MNYTSDEPSVSEPCYHVSGFSEPSVAEPGFSEALTLAQAAGLLGISVPTARRLVLSGKLRAIKLMISDRLCWRVPREAISEFRTEPRFKEVRFKVNPGSVNSDSVNPGSEPVNSASVNSSSASEPTGSIPPEALLAALETAKKALDRLENAESRLEAQLKISEEQRNRAELAERQRLALEMQLRQYQQALADQAESLAEAHALRQTAELKLETSKEAEEMAPLPLRLATPKPSFGQRVRGWFGLSRAVNL